MRYFTDAAIRRQSAREHLPQTLVVPLEVKKVFMDETTGQPDQAMIDAVRAGFNDLISVASDVFVRVR